MSAFQSTLEQENKELLAKCNALLVQLHEQRAREPKEAFAAEPNADGAAEDELPRARSKSFFGAILRRRRESKDLAAGPGASVGGPLTPIAGSPAAPTNPVASVTAPAPDTSKPSPPSSTYIGGEHVMLRRSRRSPRLGSSRRLSFSLDDNAVHAVMAPAPRSRRFSGLGMLGASFDEEDNSGDGQLRFQSFYDSLLAGNRVSSLSGGSSSAATAASSTAGNAPLSSGGSTRRASSPTLVMLASSRGRSGSPLLAAVTQSSSSAVKTGAQLVRQAARTQTPPLTSRSISEPSPASAARSVPSSSSSSSVVAKPTSRRHAPLVPVWPPVELGGSTSTDPASAKAGPSRTPVTPMAPPLMTPLRSAAVEPVGLNDVVLEDAGSGVALGGERWFEYGSV
jgi:hypothetical protein